MRSRNSDQSLGCVGSQATRPKDLDDQAEKRRGNIASHSSSSRAVVQDGEETKSRARRANGSDKASSTSGDPFGFGALHRDVG